MCCCSACLLVFVVCWLRVVCYCLMFDVVCGVLCVVCCCFCLFVFGCCCSVLFLVRDFFVVARCVLLVV